MSGTMVSDQGYLVEKKTFRLLAHATLVRGDVVKIDFATVGADSGIPDTTAAATADVTNEVLCVALSDVASGDRAWFATKGFIPVHSDAVAAAGTALSVDAGTVDRLDDSAAASNTAAKIVAYNLAVIGSAGVNNMMFNGEEGFGFTEQL